MALSSSTFSAAGGAVSDLFAGFGAQAGGSTKAQGIRLQAAGLRLKAKGDLAEAENYDLAGGLARKNLDYTVESQAIQQTQLDRKIALTIGGQKADVAGAGLKESGSAIDLLRDSAAQGALAKTVLARQGEITEAGYEEQAKSFDTMSAAARMAYSGLNSIADQTDALASATEDESKKAAMGSWISAGIKGAAAVGSLYMGNVPGAISLGASAVGDVESASGSPGGLPEQA